MSEFKTIAKVGSIPDGEGKAFPCGGKMIAVFNDGGTYRAIDDFCPHMGASLAEGHLEDGVVACPWHSWRFDTCTGKWCDNPKLSVPTYPVQVSGDEIQVKITEPDEGTAPGSEADGSDSTDAPSSKD